MVESKEARGFLRALLASGRLQSPPSPIDAIAAEARRQGVPSLLLQAIERERPEWAAPLLDPLSRERRESLVRGLRQIELGRRALALLEAVGVRALPLKGVALAESVYDLEADRPMSDVDVLALERWTDAARALLAAGFVEVTRGDHAWVYRDPHGAGLLELHGSVTSAPGLFPPDADGLWARSRPGTKQLRRRPSAEDLLVQLALHAAFQHGLVLTLVQWLDFRRVLEREAVDRARLSVIARAMRAEVPLAAALLAAGAVVEAPLGREWSAALRERLPRGLARWLAPRLADPLGFVLPTPADPLRARFELLAGRRLALVRRTVFTETPGAKASWPARVLAGLRRGWHLLRRYVLPRTGRVGSDAAGDEAPPARDARGVTPGAGATTAGTPTSAAPPLDERAIDLPSHDEPLASATPKSSPPAEPFVESLLLECLSTLPYVRVTVTGACMRPALADGERVHLAGRGARTPRLGDVVLARHPDGLRLHRLVWGPPLAPVGRPWRTMADRARLLDPRLDPADVLGTVVAVEDRPDARPRRPARALLSLGRAVLARVRAGARPEPAGAAS